MVRSRAGHSVSWVLLEDFSSSLHRQWVRLHDTDDQYQCHKIWFRMTFVSEKSPLPISIPSPNCLDPLFVHFLSHLWLCLSTARKVSGISDYCAPGDWWTDTETRAKRRNSNQRLILSHASCEQLEAPAHNLVRSFECTVKISVNLTSAARRCFLLSLLTPLV